MPRAKAIPSRQTHLGEMLRLYRTVHGHTFRELAPAIGISHATLLRIEHGYTMDVPTLLKLWTWLIGERDAQP